MESVYQKKYLKYKEKYTQLKGGYTGEKSVSSNKKMKISVATLNQWSLDFEGNEKRINAAIDMAIRDDSELILLPELAVCGYSCQDHFYEREVYQESFDMIKRIMTKYKDVKIIIAIGCPIIHKDVKYNTCIFLYRGEIVLIRPKTILADNGNYREERWFTAWPLNKYDTFSYYNTSNSSSSSSANATLSNDTKEVECPIGVSIINYNGILIAAEICEELWTTNNLYTKLYLSGCDIVLNGSGSHFEAKKIITRQNLLKNASSNGGVYVYSNLEGGDGDRLYFDGGSMIYKDGEMIAMETRFDLMDVKVLTREIDLSSILRNRLKNNSYETQASLETNKFPIIKLNTELRGGSVFRSSRNTAQLGTYDPKKELYDINKDRKELYDLKNKESIDEIKEIIDTAACWLWDYLRRSGASGFVLPLSGGADSGVTATLVYHMCTKMITAANTLNNPVVKNFIKRFEEAEGLEQLTSKQLCKYVLNTVYLPTKFSSVNDGSKIDETRKDNNYNRFDNAKDINRMTTRFLSHALADTIGSSWQQIDMQQMFEAGITGIQPISGKTFNDMKEQIESGRNHQQKTWDDQSIWDIPFQNIQARLRMINTYLLAQTIPNVQFKNGQKPNIANETNGGIRGKTIHTFLLVLGSSNMDEILVGYYTKYDASAADINPIGSLPKTYIKRVLDYYSQFVLPLKFINEATPTAELLNTVKVQTDETDMNLSYDQIYELGKLRSKGYGPKDVYTTIINDLKYKPIFNIRPRTPTPVADSAYQAQVLQIVNDFFGRYRINRNKTTIIPPSVHLMPSPDDNRYDLRPFLLPAIYFRVDSQF